MNNALIDWQTIKLTGIPIIDAQHQGIISTIISFDYFIRNQQGDYYLGAIINMIGSYTKIHFATEEALFKQFDYANLVEHKKIHDNLMKESFALANESILLRDPDIYLKFLHKWWINHINLIDQEYSDFLKKAYSEQKKQSSP